MINGTSDLMFKIFEKYGEHVRAAVRCLSPPFGASVELDGVFKLSQYFNYQCTSIKSIPFIRDDSNPLPKLIEVELLNNSNSLPAADR